PGTPQALGALRGGAGTAIQAGDWDRAEALARRLPANEDMDRVLREELLQRIDRGRAFRRWYVVSWFALASIIIALLASLSDAVVRGGRRWPGAKPPIEVLFLAPVAAVLLGVALTTHRAMAPAVLVLAGGGLVLAWLSGATLELLRARRRPIGLRALLHVVGCLVAVCALVYIVLTHDNLLEMMIETIQFGPDP
ncbi:MAG: hypothetical protein H0X17_25395, partial [Deltaproteobacteria bacterium]|nr:hypothetical protein [Deltaproteobacteria bacterium]